MACNSDYMNPNASERNSKKVCEHLVYLARKADKTIPLWVRDGAEEFYGVPSRLNEATIMLCTMCKESDEEIIYNGRCHEARLLAEWWDEHKEADRERLAREQEEADRKTTQAQALSKLTVAERKALGF